jgi:Xaa-Pro aminopeptidase
MDIREWRFERIRMLGLDAIVSVLPHHVLMLTGYRPRLGSGIGLALADGRTFLIVPSDEVELAIAAGATNVSGYDTVTLDQRVPLDRGLAASLLRIQSALPRGARVGFEDGPAIAPNAYVSTWHLGGALAEILHEGLPRARLEPAAALFRELQSRKTPAELALVRDACELGQQAFQAAMSVIAPGRPEYEVAAAAVAALAGANDGQRQGDDSPGSTLQERGGQAWVMSGPNGALAYRAFARTGTRRLEPGDLVLVHMNPEADGFWGDLTRTFVVGRPSGRCEEIIDAVFEARDASRRALHDGVSGRELDAATRSSLAARGFGAEFKHQTGHGVGFNGISGLDSPSIHPLSDDVIAEGMCFNIEPAVYIDGFGGYRHCDVLAMADGGPQELSPYLVSPDDLVVGG